MSRSLRWGILSTGRIAHTFAKGLADAALGRAIAVGSRDFSKAKAFADEHGIDRVYGSYEDLLRDDHVDAVYIATPHPVHAEWAIKAAEAGKHALVEKPIGMNASEAMAIFEAAEVNNTKTAEAFMYRYHPQTAKVVDLVRDGAIGTLQYAYIPFSFRAGYDPAGRLFANELGGGGILDVGCYTTSFARLIAGVTMGKPVAEPVQVTGSGAMLETGVDGIAAATLKFSNNFVAQLLTGVQLSTDNVVKLYGTEGRIEINSLWIPSREGGTVTIRVYRNGTEPQDVHVQTDRHLYAFEADAFAEFVHTGHMPGTGMSPADTMGNMRTLDRWRQACGLTYEMEKAQGLPKTTVAGRPVKKADNAPMIYGKIDGLEKPVARLIMGVDNQDHLHHGRVVFDDYFERGGNAFDTATVYGLHKTKVLGDWLKSRGLRDQCSVICKGSHTPENYPQSIRYQLERQLENLQSDHCDIYMMHRDNPAIPAGEYIDVLNQLSDEGLIRGAFGGSNWSLARVEEANTYAKKNGKRPFTVVSNNLSLAEMVDPVWAGCISANDPASLDWLARHNVAQLSWSSQARGFFVPGLAAPDKREDDMLVRCWYSDRNFKRLERATELAAEKGVSPINIAAAWVLHQPFPSFALIGPRQLSETRTSMPALDVTLTDAESKWLNLQSDSR